MLPSITRGWVHLCDKASRSVVAKQYVIRAGCWKGIGGLGCSGHHGIDVSHGAGNLVNRFSISTRFVHDISVEWFAVGTAFTNGQGVDINLDLHR